jgi:prepilin-type N-terminal cleavage/methylation domain-containing protein
MKRLQNGSGFTILEVIVVILIFGIFASVAVYSLSITRAMGRDNRRVSDISVMRAAMSQYWLQKASYPQNDPVDLGRPGIGADRFSSDGFVAKDQNVTGSVILDQIPVGPTAGEYYRYHGSSKGYSLRFRTERQTAYGIAGTWYAHASGVDQEDSEK